MDLRPLSDQGLRPRQFGLRLRQSARRKARSDAVPVS